MMQAIASCIVHRRYDAHSYGYVHIILCLAGTLLVNYSQVMASLYNIWHSPSLKPQDTTSTSPLDADDPPLPGIGPVY